MSTFLILQAGSQRFAIQAAGLTPPAAPGNLTATAVSTTQINLAWEDNSNTETGFVLEQSPDGVGDWETRATPDPDTVVYIASNLSPATTYYFRIKAVNSVGESAWSNVASDTTDGTPALPPAAPSNLVAATVSTTRIDLSWTDNADNETGFVVERSPDGQSGWTTIATPTANEETYSNTGLTASTTYYYRVKAVNTVGSSAYAGPVNAITNAALEAAIVSDNLQWQGGRTGTDITLLAVGGSVTLPDTYCAYTPETTTHTLEDLTPSTVYKVTVDGVTAQYTTDGNGALVFSTFGPNTHIVTVDLPGTSSNPTVRNQSFNVGQGQIRSKTLWATDPNGEALTYEITGTTGPISATGLNTSTGKFSLASTGGTGSGSITWRVRKAAGGAFVTGTASVAVYAHTDYSLFIPSGTTYTLSGDLSNYQDITISGADSTSVLDGANFRIVNTTTFRGIVRIENCTLRNLGTAGTVTGTPTGNVAGNKAIELSAKGGDAQLILDHVVLDACNQVNFNHFGGSTDYSTVTVQDCSVLASSLARGTAYPQGSTYWLHCSGGSNAKSIVERNVSRVALMSFENAKNYTIRDNVLSGHRCGIRLQPTQDMLVAGNYVYSNTDFSNPADPEYNTLAPRGSQISGIVEYQGTGVEIRDNVVRGAHWTINGLTGTLHHNLIADAESHNAIVGPRVAAQVHHNLIIQLATFSTAELGIIDLEAAATTVSISHNTFQGGPTYTVPAIRIPSGARCTVRDNLFYDIRTTGNPDGIVRASEALSGNPPLPASDTGRLIAGDHNAFHNPNASANTANYAVLLVGGGTPGTADITGNPQFVSTPPSVFAYDNADILAGSVTVEQILHFYRTTYTIHVNSPLVDAGSDTQTIGAVPFGGT